MKYFLSITLAVVLFSVKAQAQTKEEEARVLYQKAEDAYESASSDTKNYNVADDYINKVINLIGANPKSLYLEIKILIDGIKGDQYASNEHNYQKAMNLITELFGKIDKATYPPEKYTELIGIKIDVAEKLKPFADAQAQARQYYDDIGNKKAGFLKDVFDPQIQKLVKNFNDNNTAIFDPAAFTVSTNEYLERCRKFIKKYPETGPFPHHLEYNTQTKELYIYKYTPDKGLTADTVNALDLNYYDSYRKVYFDGFKAFSNQPKEPTLNLFFHPAGKKFGKDDLIFKLDQQIMDSLRVIMRDRIFNAYYRPLFTYSNRHVTHYFTGINDGWAEFAYPSKEPVAKYEVVTYQGTNTEMYLYNSSQKLFIKLTRDGYFTGKFDEGWNWEHIAIGTLRQLLNNNVTHKEQSGVWMTEMEIANSEARK